MATTTNFGWDTPDDTDLVKDGAAAIRTALNGVDTSFVDLKGGTTGQILSKNSNTDLDYTWITNDVGDITEVAAGTGISGGGTSGSVTITNSMATAIDAKGDLIGGTGADTFARLAIGTNGQVLTADSVETTGMKWAALPMNVTDYTLINAGGTALTGAATITVGSISNKNDLYVKIVGASSNTINSTFTIRLNADSGANYDQVGLNWNSTGGSNFGGITTAGTAFGCSYMDNVADTFTGHIRVEGAAGTGVKPYQSLTYGASSGTTNRNISGVYNGTSAISSISIISSAGNFDAGTIYVYGA